MSNKKDLKELTIRGLFKTNEKYLIPIYQRNYAWEKPQIEQLVEDIWDYAFTETNKHLKDKTPYFIGNLIVYNRLQANGDYIYETIDGQQRLTTLIILMSVLFQEFSQQKISEALILKFESRPQSEETLQHIHRSISRLDVHNSDILLSTRMLDAHDFIFKKLNELKKRKTNDNISINSFTEYLLNKVILLRVSVPEKTDLNHYFEIMNNRGEQLEKHEILKAQLLSYLQAPDNANANQKNLALENTKAFQTIWEGCEEMEKYIQYGFNTDHRKKIFTSDWNKFLPEEFDDVSKLFTIDNEKNKTEDLLVNSVSLFDVLKSDDYLTKKQSNSNKEELPERFNSIINFSNFLLHVLRIQVNNYESKDFEINDKDVPLDDKRLIAIFNQEIDNFQIRNENEFSNYEIKKNFAKTIAFNLLKAKFYFDQYILKRELNKDEWSLKILGTSKAKTAKYTNTFSGNNEILMLLSMFHVSYPSRLYKHWLNGVLNYTMHSELDEISYTSFLQKFAKQILFDRYLANEVAADYHTIIYKNKEVINTNPQYNNLNNGTEVENFVFNYLDYLLWKNDSLGAKEFQFAFRNSVEHYFPQNPKNEERLIPDQELKGGVDNFGNLCLVTRSQNSSLSNKEDWQKKLHYNGENVISLKQRLMMDSSEGKWNKNKIVAHCDLMLDYFKIL
ncbi:DUF262 domain-containing protein [Polaribacter atrinae]|uniref:DUF262 domain-containing protein n=1 Tax=Polaribacter atrinae TaxID=1333662 RepID=UPI002491ED69|nr:DUF262 domain-containing protein [Polaribacter atrinae]